MALLKSKLCLSFSSRSLSFLFTLRPRLFASRTDLVVVDPTMTSPSDILYTEKFFDILKHHHSRNPTPDLNPKPSDFDLTIPNLSLVFGQVSGGFPPSPSTVCAVIEKCRECYYGTPFLQVLAFFNWVTNMRNFNHSPEPYNSMIDLCGKKRHFDLAWHLIDSMKARKVDISNQTFSLLIRRYVRAGLVDEAMNAFKQMIKYGCQPDMASCSKVIDILAKLKRASEAMDFFNAIKDQIEPDVIMYTSLINAWLRVGNISEAEYVFRDMKEAGIEPNVYTYSMVIDGLCRGQQLNRAYEVLAEMKEVGCARNTVTYNNLIKFLCKHAHDKVLSVRKMFRSMIKDGCKPDTITYNFVIQAYCREHDVDGALKVFDSMLRRGCFPDTYTFYPIIYSFLRIRRLDDAVELFTRMKKMKCVPHRDLYNLMLIVYSSRDEIVKAMDLKKEMIDAGIGPNRKTYNAIIYMFVRRSNWDAAYQVLVEEIRERCMKPHFGLFHRVLEQLETSAQFKKHGALVKMAADRGLDQGFDKWKIKEKESRKNDPVGENVPNVGVKYHDSGNYRSSRDVRKKFQKPYDRWTGPAVPPHIQHPEWARPVQPSAVFIGGKNRFK